MPDRIDDLTERVQAVEEKVDQLTASVDQRFDAVDAAFLEQREYTEFCYSRLEAKIDAGFGRLERKPDQFIDAQIQTNQLVDRRLRAAGAAWWRARPATVTIQESRGRWLTTKP